MSRIMMTKATFTDRWSSLFFLFLFVLLFFSTGVSDEEKSTSVTFSAYIYIKEVITLNEQILSLIFPCPNVSVRQNDEVGMYVLLMDEQATRSNRKE